MSREPFVAVDIRHRLGKLALDARFQVTAPWTLLFAPSGSGKSTILRAIAGLLRPQVGTVSVKGELMSGPRAWVPAYRRPVRWCGQQEALFPHKTVAANLAMGGSEVEAVLDVFGLRALAGAYPAELSGGQRQKVSVVRAAMGARGGVLLLDEPFSGLDAAVRDELRAGLREWLGATPVLSITHNVEEAFLLGAEVVRIAEGRVVAQGPVADVLAAERERLLGVLRQDR